MNVLTRLGNEPKDPITNHAVPKQGKSVEYNVVPYQGGILHIYPTRSGQGMCNPDPVTTLSRRLRIRLVKIEVLESARIELNEVR